MSFTTTNTTARESLRCFRDSFPLPTSETREELKRLEQEAEAELHTDAAEMTKTADWLDRLAGEQEEAGKPFNAAENRERAAELRAKIAALATASVTNDNIETGRAA